MIENPFLLVRAALLHCNETNLRIGLIQFLKELETEHQKAIQAIQEACTGDDDGECEDAAIPFMMDPWVVADRLFQYAWFAKAQEPLDPDEEPEGFSEDEIDEAVARWGAILNQLPETDEEEEKND